MTFAEKLKEVIKNSGYRQDFICKHLNIAPVTLHYWKTGRYQPKADKIHELCVFLQHFRRLSVEFAG